jgi:hypothetical protein
MILDWTAREFRADKRGDLPDHLAAILERLGLVSGVWVDTVDQWGEQKGRWAGNEDCLAERARLLGRKWVHGIRFARRAFRR